MGDNAIPLKFSFADEVLFQKGIVLFELCNVNIDNIPIFAILMVNEEDMNRLKADVRKKNTINYNDYGKVAFAGKGSPSNNDREIARKNALLMLGEMPSDYTSL